MEENYSNVTINKNIGQNSQISKILQEILNDLDFISTIPKNAKPNFSDKTYTSTNEWFSTIKRRYKYERGEKGVIYISSLVENIIQMCKTLDENSLKNLREKLIEAIIGLNNIVYTYKIDEQPEVAKNYELSIEKINKLITQIENNKKFKNFFHHQPFIKVDLFN